MRLRTVFFLAACLFAAIGTVWTQTITTVAGNGTAGYSGDGGPATQAAINGAPAIATDSFGNLYIADQNNNRVRRVDPKGVITTVAGNGTQGFSGDGGPAVQASMYIPIRCVVDATGNLYVTDQSGQKIRMISPAGIISTFAGNGTNAGPHSIGTYSGDGGPAITASLNNPTAITVDSAGNIYFSDQYNQRIRKVDKNGTITTIAGNGTAGFSGDNGPATSAALNYPGGLFADQNGDIYFADDVNNRVRKISGSAITTVAGNGAQGFSGDNGPALQAEFNGQFGVALDAAGNVFIADSANNRIRKVSSLAAGTPPKITAASVTNGASFQSGISAGALISIFGTNLSNNVHGIAGFNAVPLPTTLAGASVLIGGTAIPLFDVINIDGTEQINAQAPFEIAGQPNVNIVINNGRAQNTAVQLAVSAAQPGIFLLGGGNGAFLHADESVVTEASPASPGEVLLMFCTGLGAVTPPGTTGALASSTTLSYSNLIPAVTVGNNAASISFYGLAPALVGLYQINFTVPSGTPSGSANVVVTSNGVSSNTAKLPMK